MGSLINQTIRRELTPEAVDANYSTLVQHARDPQLRVLSRLCGECFSHLTNEQHSNDQTDRWWAVYALALALEALKAEKGSDHNATHRWLLKTNKTLPASYLPLEMVPWAFGGVRSDRSIRPLLTTLVTDIQKNGRIPDFFHSSSLEIQDPGKLGEIDNHIRKSSANHIERLMDIFSQHIEAHPHSLRSPHLLTASLMIFNWGQKKHELNNLSDHQKNAFQNKLMNLSAHLLGIYDYLVEKITPENKSSIHPDNLLFRHLIAVLVPTRLEKGLPYVRDTRGKMVMANVHMTAHQFFREQRQRVILAESQLEDEAPTRDTLRLRGCNWAQWGSVLRGRTRQERS